MVLAACGGGGVGGDSSNQPPTTPDQPPTAPNQPPTAAFTASSANGDAPLTVAFGASASNDPDGLITQYNWAFGDGGAATGVTTSHVYAVAGTFTVTLTVRDDGGATSTATQSVTVASGPPPGGENGNVIANDDSAIVQEDGSIAIDVLANDSATGGTLHLSSWAAAAHGTITADLAGNLIYAPVPDYWGSDTFQYTIEDELGARATATVTVTVTARPDAPVARDDSATTATETPVQILPLGNDSDADSDTLSIASFSQATNGAVVPVGNGALEYTPRSGFTGSDSFTYVVSDGTGLQDSASVMIEVQSRSVDAFLQLITAAPEGSWLKVNLNRFSEVWTPLAQRAGPQSNQNPARIIFAWSSMAWDPNRRQLIFWGGGHANYAGNEVYRFDAISRRWERASLPSEVYAPLGDQQYFAVDGPMNAPIAAHTYDNQEFLPLVDRFITFGGGKFNCCAHFVLEDGVTPTGPYLWDPSRADSGMVGGTSGSQVSPLSFPDVLGGRMWQNRNAVAINGSGSPRPNNFVNGTTAYAAYNGKDSILVSEKPTEGGRLYRYVINDVADPSQDQWLLAGVAGKAAYGDQGAGAYDPQRNIFARTANGSNGRALIVWSLQNPGATNEAVSVPLTDASGTFALSSDHGMDFDAVRGVFVLWDGGPDVWYVTPPASFGATGWTVTRAPTSGASTAPDKASGSLVNGTKTTTLRGILGKWKYARAYDVFMGVEDPVNGDVWVYKPTHWQPLAGA